MWVVALILYSCSCIFKMSGRKRNENFGTLRFELIKSGGKYAARCLLCKNVIKNTAAARLQGHRNVCKFAATSGSNGGIDEISENNGKLAATTSSSIEVASNEVILPILGEYEVMDDGSLARESVSGEATDILMNRNAGPPNETVSNLSSAIIDVNIVNNIEDAAPMSSSSGTEKRNAFTLLSPPSKKIKKHGESPSTSNVNVDNPANDIDYMDNVTVVASATIPGTPKVMSAGFPISKKTRKITNYIDRLQENEEEKINTALAKLIFGCNLPFILVDSPLFKNFIKVLRPAYAEKIPGRKKLSTTLLENCYKQCLENDRMKLKTESVILCDGWKNSANNTKTVVTMLHNTNGVNSFIDAWDLTTDSETVEKLSEIIIKSRELALEKYNVDCFGVVSDNASAMVKMGSLLKHVMWHSTCNSHIGNLLAKDILNKTLVENVTLVLKEFKQPDFEKMIVMRGGRRIKLPAETRWCSYRDSFKSFLENLDEMKQITAVTKKKIKPKVTELIFSDDFIEEVQRHVQIHDPICHLINTCQNSETSVADAVSLWLNIELPAQFQGKLKHRQDMALNVYALSAYYLHPGYNKAKLTSDHTAKINAFLFRNLNAQGIEEWDKYNTRSGIFAILFEKGIEKPLVFWRMAQMECAILGSLALKLLMIPASSAQIERLFSNWGHIHSLLRNRLTFENSKKLVHIYFSLRCQYPDTNEEQELEESLSLD